MSIELDVISEGMITNNSHDGNFMVKVESVFNEAVAEKVNAACATLTSEIIEKDKTIIEKDKTIIEKDKTIMEKDNKISQLEDELKRYQVTEVETNEKMRIEIHKKPMKKDMAIINQVKKLFMVDREKVSSGANNSMYILHVFDAGRLAFGRRNRNTLTVIFLCRFYCWNSGDGIWALWLEPPYPSHSTLRFCDAYDLHFFMYLKRNESILCSRRLFPMYCFCNFSCNHQ